jgi:hydrogenase nickel incorporation protein HypA/HybF
MHEMSLAEEVLLLVEATARRENATRVKLIVLEIGRLSAVEPEALQFCFASVAQGSIAQTAALEIIDTPGVGRCLDCAESVAMSELYGTCPHCGSHRLQATAGTAMRVREIEIE